MPQVDSEDSPMDPRTQRAHNPGMSRRVRAVYVALAAAGGASLVASMVLPAFFITTYATLLAFYLVVALPLYVAGLFAFLKAPEHPTARRFLLIGVAFSVADLFEVLLG